MVQQDYSRTCELLRSHAAHWGALPQAGQNELEAFKAYLRDQGLRYAEAADSEGAAAAGASD